MSVRRHARRGWPGRFAVSGVLILAVGVLAAFAPGAAGSAYGASTAAEPVEHRIDINP